MIKIVAKKKSDAEITIKKMILPVLSDMGKKLVGLEKRLVFLENQHKNEEIIEVDRYGNPTMSPMR